MACASPARYKYAMRAYKTLSEGRSQFTGLSWPLPAGGQPGAWVQADGPIALCDNGIHACDSHQLPHWIGMELWEVELGGEIVRESDAVIASRARLLRRVEAWDEPTRRRFATWCLERARELSDEYPQGAGLVAKVEHTIWWGGAAPAGYFTAMLAGERVAGGHSGPDYDSAFLAERKRQADWLRQELALSDQ